MVQILNEMKWWNINLATFQTEGKTAFGSPLQIK
jgi:hypothetical protein